MIVGAYELHLSCERCPEQLDITLDAHGGLLRAVQVARHDWGWRVEPETERALCPTCKPKGWPPIDRNSQPE